MWKFHDCNFNHFCVIHPYDKQKDGRAIACCTLKVNQICHLIIRKIIKNCDHQQSNFRDKIHLICSAPWCNGKLIAPSNPTAGFKGTTSQQWGGEKDGKGRLQLRQRNKDMTEDDGRMLCTATKSLMKVWLLFCYFDFSSTFIQGWCGYRREFHGS